MSRNFGLTLVELLIGLLLISLLFVCCLPIFLPTYQNNQLQVLSNKLTTAIHFARNTALTHHLPLTLSPLPHSKDWSKGMILFVDNKKHQYTEKDQLLYRWDWPQEGVHVSWQGFYSNNYLFFAPDLESSALNGHFKLENNAGKSIKVVINRLGRVWSR